MYSQNVRGALLAMLISALMAAGVLFAGNVKADPTQDYYYFSILENNGFRISSPQRMKHNATIVCSDLRSGVNWRIVMTRIMSEADYDMDSAALILSAAIIAYCPEQDPQVSDNRGAVA